MENLSYLYKDAKTTEIIYPYTLISAVEGLEDKLLDIDKLENKLYTKDVGITVPNQDGITAVLSGTELSYVSKASNGYVYFTNIPIGDYILRISDGGEQYAEKQISIKPDYTDMLTFFSATITVAYPSGSTLTCSDGTTTLTATSTTGSYTFTVPNAGTWTVSCTDGSSTASTDVSITSDGQTASVTLSYALYLYNNGAVSGYSWTAKDDEGTDTTITDKGTYLQLIADVSVYAVFYSKSKINVSGYKTLKMTLTNVSMQIDSGDTIWFGLSSNTNVQGTGMSTKTEYSSFSGTKTLSVDISKVTTSMYVMLYVPTSVDDDFFSARATKIWLE